MESVTSLMHSVDISSNIGVPVKRGEAVVWRVFRYKILFRMILDQWYDDELFGRRVFTGYGISNRYFERIRKYRQIVDVDWMIRNNYISILKEKLKRGEYIETYRYYDPTLENIQGLKGMGTVCTLQDTELFNTIYSRYQDAFIWDGLLEWAAIGGNPSIMDTLINQTTPTILYNRESQLNYRLYISALKNSNFKLIDYLIEKDVPIRHTDKSTRVKYRFKDLQCNNNNNKIIGLKGLSCEVMDKLCKHPLKVLVFIESIGMEQLIEYTTKISSIINIESYRTMIYELLNETPFIVTLQQSTIKMLIKKIQYIITRMKELNNVNSIKIGKNQYNIIEIESVVKELKEYNLKIELESILELLIYLQPCQNIYHHCRNSKQVYQHITNLIGGEITERLELIEFINSKIFKSSSLFNHLSISQLNQLQNNQNNNNQCNNNVIITNIKQYQYPSTGISATKLQYLIENGYNILYKAEDLYNAILNLDYDMVKLLLDSTHFKTDGKASILSFKMHSTLTIFLNPIYTVGKGGNEAAIKIFKLIVTRYSKLNDIYPLWTDMLWDKEWVDCFIEVLPKPSLDKIPVNTSRIFRIIEKRGEKMITINLNSIFKRDDLEAYKLLEVWFNGLLEIPKSIVIVRENILIHGQILRYLIGKGDFRDTSFHFTYYWTHGYIQDTKYLHQSYETTTRYERWAFTLFLGNVNTIEWVEMFKTTANRNYILIQVCKQGNFEFLKEIVQKYSPNEGIIVIHSAMKAPYPNILDFVLQYPSFYKNMSMKCNTIRTHMSDLIGLQSMPMVTKLIEWIESSITDSQRDNTYTSILNELNKIPTSSYFKTSITNKVKGLLLTGKE